MPVGYNNLPSGHNTMQYLIITASHGRVLAKQDSAGEVQETIRICNEEQIKDMNPGSLRLYRRKVLAWRTPVHENGTTSAIKTIDFLAGATARAATAATAARQNNPPVC